MENKNDKKVKGIVIALSIIIGFVGIMAGSVIIILKDYNINFSENNLTISIKEEKGEDSSTEKKDLVLRTVDKLATIRERFALKNNIVSIVILIIGVTLYIIAKRRNDYVKREKD